MALLRGCVRNSTHGQTQVLELDGQEGVPKVTSPRSKSAADRECLETMSCIITYCPVNRRFREGYQS